MTILSAENAFKKGLTALVKNRPKEASEFFRKALELERQRSKTRLDMRYLSYYGLSLAKAGLSSQIALQACRSAVTRHADDPLLLLNLGRVYLITGKLEPALECFEKGLRVQPENQILRRELAKVDRRGRPMVPFLDRSHPVNRWLGRKRFARRGRAPDVGYAGATQFPP